MTASEDLHEAWVGFCEGLKGAVDHVVDPDREVSDDERAEGVRHVVRMLSMQLEQVFENDDPLHPELGWRYPSKMGQDNPDGLYQTAPLDLAHTYRLSGTVGTVRSLGFAIMTWTFGTAPIRQLVELDGADLMVGPDGDFEVFFSSQPAPADAAPGTWFELEALPTRLLVRQFFADWETERAAELHLECLDASVPPPRLTSADVVDKLGRAGAMSSFIAAYWTEFGEGHLTRGEINRFAEPEALPDTSGLGGTERQAYHQCLWRVGADEVLLLSFTPPACHYWEIQLGDRWYQSLDYINRSITINDAQAAVDDDGVVRIAICGHDPGIANWLDTAGVADGYITVRYNLAESDPVPEFRLLAAAELDDHLPASTARLTSAERTARQRSQRRAALGRFRR